MTTCTRDGVITLLLMVAATGTTINVYHSSLYIVGIIINNAILRAASDSLEITTGPKNASAIVGGEVIFQCEYQGTPDLPQWRINGINYRVTAYQTGTGSLNTMVYM